jgi:hypothetical protein
MYGSDSDEETDLSFHIDSTYCSSSESDEEKEQLLNIPTRKDLPEKLPKKGSTSRTVVKLTPDFKHDESNPPVSFKNHAMLSMNQTQDSTNLSHSIDEPSMLASSCQFPAHIPSHSIISPMVPKVAISPRSDGAGRDRSRDAGFTQYEIEQLQTSILHLKERVSILQGDNHRLQIQATLSCDKPGPNPSYDFPVLRSSGTNEFAESNQGEGVDKNGGDKQTTNS